MHHVTLSGLQPFCEGSCMKPPGSFVIVKANSVRSKLFEVENFFAVHRINCVALVILV